MKTNSAYQTYSVYESFILRRKIPPELSIYMTSWILYLHKSILFQRFYLCGDWNIRCSGLPEYIEGVDILQEGNVVDFQHNSYGTIFCDFLIEIGCCLVTVISLCVMHNYVGIGKDLDRQTCKQGKASTLVNSAGGSCEFDG